MLESVSEANHHRNLVQSLEQMCLPVVAIEVANSVPRRAAQEPS